jgi:amidase
MTNRPSRPTFDRRDPWTRRQLLEGFAATLATAAALGAARSPAQAAMAAAATAVDSTALPAELWRAGAGQLAAAIAQRRVTSLEVVESHLARIAAVDTKVNAMPVVFADEARAAARLADAAVATGVKLGPLHGVPFTIKDNLDQAGKPNTNGLAENKTAVSRLDAPVVERMKAAGAIPLGRTNLPDLALRVHSYSELWGRTLNPWNS